MSTELLPCPCCNGKAETSDGGFGPIDAMPMFNLFFVGCTDCGLLVAAKTLEQAIAACNRRFVCLDKNGKKVFAGDKVKYTPQGQARQHMESYRCNVTEFRAPCYGYGLCGENDFTCCSFYSSEIELIESDGE